MKKKLLPIVLALCALLSACGKTAEVKAAYEDFASNLSAADSISFQAEVRAEYEHKTARFTLSYAEGAEGADVTVVSPELIAGISAHVEKGGTSLEYGSVSLDTGDLDSRGLSPMSALPVLVQAMKAGSFESFWEEDGKTVLQLAAGDGLLCAVWFGDGMTPLYAELTSDGRVVIYAEITDWSVSPQGAG